MKKWIQKVNHTLLTRPIFSVSDIECYHPEKKVNHTFFRLSTHDWINVVAKDVEGNYIMVRQHRLGTDEITIETVGGLIDKNEASEKAAKRELEEETGYTAENIHHLKTMTVNPAIMDNSIHVFYAENCTLTAKQNLDHAEDIETLLLQENALVEMIQKGEINHSIVINALSLFWLSPYNENKTIIIP